MSEKGEKEHTRDFSLYRSRQEKSEKEKRKKKRQEKSKIRTQISAETAKLNRKGPRDGFQQVSFSTSFTKDRMNETPFTSGERERKGTAVEDERDAFCETDKG